MADLTLVCSTPRLALRRLTPDDADAAFILRLLNEPSFHENIGDRGVRSLADARTYILDGAVASYQQHGFGMFRVDLLSSGEAIGLCGLLKRDWLVDVDVGFAFFPQHWSRGYAFESASAAIEWGRAAHGIARVVGITKPDNYGSMRVLEKLGMRFTRLVVSPEGQESRLFEPR